MIHESATTIARKIASIPARTSSETWRAIVDLLAEPSSAAYRELTAITGIAAILISEEYTRQAPIIVMPASGSRIRIRTVHGMDAIEEINDETPLYSGKLAESGWSLSLPCGADDLDEITDALAGNSAVTVRDVSEGITVQAAVADYPAISAAPGMPVLNLEEMRRP